MNRPAARPAGPFEPRLDGLAPAARGAGDYEALARACLDPEVWRYLSEGSGAGLTMAANRRAFEHQGLLPRPLTDMSRGHTRLVLFGQALEHPILLAPIAYQRLFHAEGEMASAMAAAAQGSCLTVSSLASQPLESIAAAARGAGGTAWFQLYWQGERATTLRLAQRAEAAGCPVLMLTLDAPVKPSTLVLPAGIEAVNLEAPLTPAPIGPGQSVVFQGWMARAPDWEDLAWLRQHLRLPLLVKGLLHADDVERALALGCDGLVVSNHGGRVLDGMPASLELLPGLVHQVAGRVPVLLDSGIRDGRDVFRALALGAEAVLLGRPYVWGLARAGALGVAHVLRLLRDELEATMALCGCASLADIRASRGCGHLPKDSI
ncbi:MAG TPA: alpha-hydroxy acid oxidase [Thiobacillaceae bacterium]|nr:alpha-hydroxy acid oxidase [Thiobacillaceae bacterium]HNU64173.1 alpha-hydroxy acid oxidase [Thiobacillaceae bacterium]